MKRVSNLTDSNHEYMNSQSSPSYNQKMSGKFVSNQEFEQALGSGKDGPVVLKQMLIGQRDISNSFKIGRKLQIKEFQIIQEESKLNTVREKQVQYGQSKPTETSAPSSVKNKDEQKNKFRRSSPLNKSMSSSKRNIQSSTLQNSQNRGGSSPRGKTDSVSKLKSLVIAKSVKKKSDAEASANQTEELKRVSENKTSQEEGQSQKLDWLYEIETLQNNQPKSTSSNKNSKSIQKYQEIEQKILEVSERLIAIHRDQKYKGMYKNVLEANRRSHYTKKYGQRYSRRSGFEKKNSSSSPFQKIQPLSSPLNKIQLTRSTRRILDDLSDPQDPKNQYFAKLDQLNQTQADGFKEILQKIEEFKRKQFKSASELQVGGGSQQALDQICEHLVSKETRQKHVIQGDQLTGKTEHVDGFQSMNGSMKNSLEYDNKMISIEINKDEDFEKLQNTQRSFEPKVGLAQRIFWLDKSHQFNKKEKNASPTSDAKNDRQESVNHTMLRTSHEHTNTTGMAELAPSPHSKTGPDPDPGTMNDHTAESKNQSISNNIKENFSNFRVSGLKLVLQKNVKTADGKARASPNLQIHSSKNHQVNSNELKSQESSSKHANQKEQILKNASSIQVKTQLQQQQNQDIQNAFNLQAANDSSNPYSSQAFNTLTSQKSPMQQQYSAKIAVPRTQNILKKPARHNENRSSTQLNLNESSKTKQRELSIESDQFTKKKIQMLERQKLSSAHVDSNNAYDSIEQQQQQYLLSNQKRKNIHLSSDKQILNQASHDVANINVNTNSKTQSKTLAGKGLKNHNSSTFVNKDSSDMLSIFTIKQMKLEGRNKDQWRKESVRIDLHQAEQLRRNAQIDKDGGISFLAPSTENDERIAMIVETPHGNIVAEKMIIEGSSSRGSYDKRKLQEQIQSHDEEQMAQLNQLKRKAYTRPTASRDMIDDYQNDFADGFPGQEKRGSTQLKGGDSINITPDIQLHQGPQTLDSPLNPNILVQKISVRENSERLDKQTKGYNESSEYVSHKNMDLADATNYFSSIHQVNQHNQQSIIS